MKQPTLTFLILSLLTIVGCAPKQNNQGQQNSQCRYNVTVQGAVNRQITQKEFYLEAVGEEQEHIYIQEMGPGNDIKVLEIVFPKASESTTYQLTSNDSAKGGYYEVVGNVSRQFHENVKGTLVVNRSEQGVSGSFDFVAAEPLSGQTVRINGGYELQRAVAVPENITQKPLKVNTNLLLWTFWILIALNFVFQIYVGNIVYEGQGMSLLRSFRGTRTFILGWRDPTLREVMIVWSILLLALGGIILFGLSLPSL